MRTLGEMTERSTRPPEMMQPSLTSESVARPTRSSSSLAKTNFAGAAVGLGAGVDGPPGIVERELGVHRHQVHVAVVVGVEVSHVAPVAGFLRFLAGDLVGGEIVDRHLGALVHLADDRLAEVVRAVLSRVAHDLAHQRFGGEEVVAHRDQRRARVADHRLRILRLLLESIIRP